MIFGPQSRQGSLIPVSGSVLPGGNYTVGVQSLQEFGGREERPTDVKGFTK